MTSSDTNRYTKHLRYVYTIMHKYPRRCVSSAIDACVAESTLWPWGADGMGRLGKNCKHLRNRCILILWGSLLHLLSWLVIYQFVLLRSIQGVSLCNLWKQSCPTGKKRISVFFCSRKCLIPRKHERLFGRASVVGRITILRSCVQHKSVACRLPFWNLINFDPNASCFNMLRRWFSRTQGEFQYSILI